MIRTRGIPIRRKDLVKIAFPILTLRTLSDGNQTSDHIVRYRDWVSRIAFFFSLGY